MKSIALYFLGACLLYLLYDFYKLWSNPKGHWQQFVHTQQWIRARGPSSIFSLFEADPWNWENNPDRYILTNRIFNFIFISWVMLMIALVFFNVGMVISNSK